MITDRRLEQVRSFWESQPLFTGESHHPPGTREFFEEHRRTVIDDGFAGHPDARVLPDGEHRLRVLDLGCGPGFWTIELAAAGCASITATDITDAALALTRRRCELFDVGAVLQRENAESLSFRDGAFTHVNCQGVIHHTVDPSACVREIARVLEPGGTASISVYYRNALLRCWPALRLVAAPISGAIGLTGRGRETILRNRDVNDIVRQYDGATNPIGIAFSRAAFVELLQPYFDVDDVFLHYFPARALPFGIPRFVHRWLDRKLGFLIYAQVRKR